MHRADAAICVGDQREILYIDVSKQMATKTEENRGSQSKKGCSEKIIIIIIIITLVYENLILNNCWSLYNHELKTKEINIELDCFKKNDNTLFLFATNIMLVINSPPFDVQDTTQLRLSSSIIGVDIFYLSAAMTILWDQK